MTEQQKQELILGFGFIDFDKNLKTEPPPSPNYKPSQEHEFSKGSLEVFRMHQDSKNQKVKLTREESYKAIQYIIDNNINTNKL